MPCIRYAPVAAAAIEEDMAIIACGERGRAVSDKASVCIGRGTPLNTPSGIDLVPKRSTAPPPSRAKVRRRALMAVSMLVLGECIRKCEVRWSVRQQR